MNAVGVQESNDKSLAKTGCEKCEMVIAIKKICKRDRGSTTIETSLLMPVILLIIYVTINLYLGAITESKQQAQGIEQVYTYTENDSYSNQNDRTVSMSDDEVTYLQEFEDKNVEYKTEYSKCTARLRRWQLYGDVLCK